MSDRPAVRCLLDEVATHYDERALSSSLPPLSDLTVAAWAVHDAVAGFGPLHRHLDERTAEQTSINDRLTVVPITAEARGRR